MKALSILQPWADAILTGAKRVENRTWYTNYRGPFLIHAGKKFDGEGMEFIMDVYKDIGLALARPLLSAAPVRRGVILGRATLVDCVKAEDAPEGQERWALGPWCFVIADPISFTEPVPLKGALGFFDVPDSAIASSSISARGEASL
jgi:hypothetical protein